MSMKKISRVNNKRLKYYISAGIFVALAVAVGIISQALRKPTSDLRSYASEDTIHRLGTKMGPNKRYELYDTVTGKSVLLRGNNYIRMLPKGFPVNFRVGAYNHDQHNNALIQMKASGYNAVRVTFIYEDAANKTGAGISDEYIKNVVDYIKLAKQQGIYIFGVLAYLPRTGGYWPANNPDFEGDITNKMLLQKEFVEAKSRYVHDFFVALKKNKVPLETVALWSIENEVLFEDNKKPLSMNSGKVTTANGKTYDMSISADHQRMMDEGLVYYMNTVRKSIREVDDQALVGISVMNNIHLDGPDDHRIIYSSKLFSSSEADFFDLHFYPGFYDIDQELKSYGIGNSAKPLILGEFGAYPSKYNTLEQGATVLRDVQIMTCNNYNFKGWFAYDWDTTEISSWFRIYQVTEGNGAINTALAPKYRANPCQSDQQTITGKIETMSPNGLVSGWVYDPELSTKTAINFYIDDAYPNSDWSNMIGSTTTSVSRLDIQRTNPWMGSNIGYSFQIPEKYLTDGKSHKLYAQAVDIQLDAKKGNYLLPGSGITMPALSSPPTDTEFTVSTPCAPSLVVYPKCVSKNGKYDIEITNAPNASKAMFYTWNTENDPKEIAGKPSDNSAPPNRMSFIVEL